VIATAAQREAKRSRIPVPVLLVPAGMLFLVVFVLRYESRDPWLSAVQGVIIGSLALALNSPAFAVLAPVFTEYSTSAYYLPEGISLRLLATLLGFVLGLGGVLRLLSTPDRRTAWVIGPALLLVLIATAINSMFTSIDYTIQYLRYQSTQLMVLLLVAGALQARQDVKRIGLIVLTVAVLSSIVAIWQHYDRGSAPYVGRNLAFVTFGPSRSIGLNMSFIHLANTLLWVGVGAIGFLLANRWRADRRHIALLACGVMAIAAVYFTYTRSAMLALGPGLIAMSVFLTLRRRVLVLAVITGAVVSYFALQGTGIIGVRYYKDASKDKSAAVHLALFEVGLRVALDNPILGIGHEAFEKMALEYAGEIETNQTGDGPSGVSALGSVRPHNDFLLVWMSWGIFGLLAYCGIFGGALLNFAKAAGSGDPLIRGLAVAGAGGLGAYAANSFFHNYLDSSTLLWVFAGLSIALARLPDQVLVGASRMERVERTRRLARLTRRPLATV
jgi:O-antigen ligase